MPFEQKITFGLKTYVGFNTFGQLPGQAIDLKPQFGIAAIGNFRTHRHLSMRHELVLGYSRYYFDNSIYTISYPWLLNFHFKDHAYVNCGIQPSLVFIEDKYIEKLTGSKDINSAFEVSAMVGVEYPVDDNLDFGIRVIKSLNSLLNTDLPDYNGIVFSFSYYWDRFSRMDKKLMIFRKHKSRSDM